MSEFPPRPDADDLTQSLRRARAADADRAERRAGSRATERYRLETLLARVEASLAASGPRGDLFDPGVTQGFPRRGAPGRPRLFLDALAFFEARRGGRGFRLLQDSRWGRLTLGEADDVDEAVRLALDYCARRLLERERALVSDQTVEDAARRLLAEDAGVAAGSNSSPLPAPAAAVTRNPARHAAADSAKSPNAGSATSLLNAASAARPSEPAPEARRRLPSLAFSSFRLPGHGRGEALAERGLLFVIQLLGSAALTLLVALAMWWAWKAAAPAP